MDAQVKLRIEGKRLCSRRDAQINLGEVDYAAGMAEIDYREGCTCQAKKGGVCSRHGGGGDKKLYLCSTT
eukprot:scaffold4735_cov104-Skeletonema_dohrnii-CCMP3373.AAC.10